MKEIRYSCCLLVPLLFSLFSNPVFSEETDPGKLVLEKFESFLPSDTDLGMYRLDWESDLEKATSRARSEERPILLVIIHARYGDITSGHC